MLQQSGFPAHFIVDQGRSGQQNLRQQWGDWCNIKGAGFGTRPTTNTGSSLIDSIVWGTCIRFFDVSYNDGKLCSNTVKPGGESDGTSNSSSPRFDSTCSLVSGSRPFMRCGKVLIETFSLMRRNLPLKLERGSRHTLRRLSQRLTLRCKRSSLTQLCT